jgi:hypothetical protein
MDDDEEEEQRTKLIGFGADLSRKTGSASQSYSIKE